jgi:hypothetical protein
MFELVFVVFGTCVYQEYSRLEVEEPAWSMGETTSERVQKPSSISSAPNGFMTHPIAGNTGISAGIAMTANSSSREI